MSNNRISRVSAMHYVKMVIRALMFFGVTAIYIFKRITGRELLFDSEKHIQLVIDQPLMEDESICAHPGLSVSTLRLAREDLLRYVEQIGHSPVYVTLPDSDPEG